MNIKYSLFTDTICDGYVPSSVESGPDMEDRWDQYDTLHEAQLECLEILEDQIQQVIDGERDLDDADLCGYDPYQVRGWIREFREHGRPWGLIVDKIELTYNPEMVEVFPDGSIQIIYDLEKKDFGRKYPPPALAPFR